MSQRERIASVGTLAASVARDCRMRADAARSRAAGEALGRAAASTYGLLKRTAEANSREILLVEAQEEFVKPTTTFAVEAV